MRYLGGKYRIARHVAGVIAQVQRERRTYVEPFVGGAAVASRVAPWFSTVLLSDVVPDLVLMWDAAIDGWEPPDELDEVMWRQLRSQPPSALRGFAGFGCSFGGRWFEGYARQRTAGGAPAKEPSLAPSAKRTLLRQAHAMKHATVRRMDYRDVKVDTDTVLYADPPYDGVTTYGAAGPFNSMEFWDVAAGWSADGAAVVVSQTYAPPGWLEVWQAGQPSYLRGDQRPDLRTERLFVDPHTAFSLGLR